jgi:hypothetical protein
MLTPNEIKLRAVLRHAEDALRHDALHGIASYPIFVAALYATQLWRNQ